MSLSSIVMDNPCVAAISAAARQELARLYLVEMEAVKLRAEVVELKRQLRDAEARTRLARSHAELPEVRR